MESKPEKNAPVEQTYAEKAMSVRKRYSTSVDTKKLPKNVKNVVKNEKTNETISIPPIREMDSLQEIIGSMKTSFLL
jgi:hypothetical protein